MCACGGATSGAWHPSHPARQARALRSHILAVARARPADWELSHFFGRLVHHVLRPHGVRVDGPGRRARGRPLQPLQYLVDRPTEDALLRANGRRACAHIHEAGVQQRRRSHAAATAVQHLRFRQPRCVRPFSGPRSTKPFRDRAAQAREHVYMLPSLVGRPLPLGGALDGPSGVKLHEGVESGVRGAAHKVQRIGSEVHVSVDRQNVVAARHRLSGEPPPLQKQHVRVSLLDSPVAAGCVRRDVAHADARVAAADAGRPQPRHAQVVARMRRQVEVRCDREVRMHADRAQVGNHIAQHRLAERTHPHRAQPARRAEDHDHHVALRRRTSRKHRVQRRRVLEVGRHGAARRRHGRGRRGG